MFTGLSPLLLAGLSFLPAGGEKEERFPYLYSYSAFSPPSGKVLDVLDNGQVLISFGKSQGARKGMQLDIYHADAKAGYLGRELIGRIELVEVGAKHSIGRFRAKVKPAQENDMVLLVYEMPAMPMLPTPVWQQRGGAILDPEGLLKRK
ncbi:MAG: hypothetical protein HYR84_11165 [Planctomycetes bacterium]|nr:hypothetical protein [Planctomycetota bacterium]